MERLLRYYVVSAADGQAERAGAMANQLIAGLQQWIAGKPAAQVTALDSEVERALRDHAAFERGAGESAGGTRSH